MLILQQDVRFSSYKKRFWCKILTLKKRKTKIMAKEVTYEFIKEIPKAELSILHLEGTLEPDLKLRLAQKKSN